MPHSSVGDARSAMNRSGVTLPVRFELNTMARPSGVMLLAASLPVDDSEAIRVAMPQVTAREARVAIQRSLPPVVPARSLATMIVRPSYDTSGVVSFAVLDAFGAM